MFRGRHGGTILLLVIATITALAIVAMADDAEATWSGEPLPPWGGDWYINQDTVYTDETIRLDGNIFVWAPNTLSLDGCTVIFNCSYPGQHGIMPEWGSVLYINDSVSNQGIVKSNASSEDWWFEIYGEAYLNGVDLQDIDNGIWNWNTYMYMEGCTVSSSTYGIWSFTDGHIGNTTINVLCDSFIWTGYAEAIGVYSSGGDLSLHNLDINVVMDINETISPTSYYYGDYFVYGLYIYSTDVGKLEPDMNSEFSISIDVDVEVHNYYDTTGYATFYNYFYTQAIYLGGSTVCRAISDIDISISEDVTCVAHNASMGARFIVYNYQDYIYTTISNSGMAPAEISDITLSGLGANAHTMGTLYSLDEYYYNYAIEIRDSNGAQPGDVITTFHDIVIEDSMLEYGFYTPRYGEWMMYDCTFDDLVIKRVLEMYYTDMDFTISDCTFTDITAMADFTTLFRLYRTVGEGLLNNNTFDNIEGWRLFEMYYPGDRVYFQFNTVSDNTQWDHVYDSWFYIYESQDRVYIRWNTFEDSYYAEGLFYTMYTRDMLVLEGNTIQNNEFFDYMLYTYRNYNDVDVADNDIMWNVGPLFQIEYVNGRWTMSDENLISNNDVGADYLIYTYAIYSEMTFTDNTFSMNRADGALIFFRGVTYWSAIDFTFDRNTLSDNTASSALNGGIVVFRGIRYNTAVRRNVFTGNTGTCINFYRPFSSNTWYSAYTHTVDGNIFKNNDGAATTWIDYRSYNIVVKRNTGSNNTGPLLYHTITAKYVYDYFNPNTVGEMTGALSIEASSNNYSYNHGGAIDINPAQWVDANTPYNNVNQRMLLSNNDLLSNGDGWAIRVMNFGEFPLLVNNNVYGSKYGVYLHAINNPARWPRDKMVFEGERFDGGGPGGMTAWGLVNIDADFTDCSFTNYIEALYARDCTINVYWSAIPEGSGRTEGRGYIYVWNHLEVLITWADATGVDSGMPAAGATLAMLGTNGRYYGALTANDEGRIGPLMLMPWSSIEGKMDQWSPYDGTISSGGLTSFYIVNLVGEHVGDDAMHMLIQDTVVPEVVVTSPAMGSMSNMVDMPIEGFLFETGSGITSFMGYMDGGMGVEIDPELTWMAIFNDLAQGEHTIVVEAVDVAQNKANTTVTFLIDAVAPDLDIVSPADMYVTRDPNLLIQGSYQDDVSDLSEIEVRINGRVLSSTTGVINEYETLTEGVNTLIIDATDAAGNTQIVRRIVTLDSYPPTLYVYSPLNLLVTADPILEVNGLSEAGTPILIEQVRASNGELIGSQEIVAKADGTFRVFLDLIEGDQHIVFTAEDPAENVRSLTRTVTLDTTPPGLTINSPQEGDYIANSVVPLVAQVTDDDLDNTRVIVNGIPVDHAGLISVTIPLVEGINTIVVIAIDAVDNQVVRMVNVTRDTIAPDLMVDTPDFVLTNVKDLVVRGTVDDDADIVTVAGTPVNVDEDNKFSRTMDLTEADRPIIVVATDLAGNMAMYTIDFVFDNEKPEIDLVDPPQATTTDLVIMLNGTVTDNVAIILTVTVRGEVHPVVDGMFNVLLVVDTAGQGWNNFTISATDDAGNTGVYKMNIRYEAEDIVIVDDGPEDNLWWYFGLLFIIAAMVILVTVFVFAKRGEEE